jgi:hypothetical protein
MRYESRRALAGGRTLTRRAMLAILGASATGIALAGCGTTGGRSPDPAIDAGAEDVSTRFAVYEPADEPNGDLAMVTWPDWLAHYDPEVKRLYEFQVVNGDLMRWMPCFCGCHRGDGHRNNRDCYVEAVNPDGSVVFDSMAPT